MSHFRPPFIPHVQRGKFVSRGLVLCYPFFEVSGNKVHEVTSQKRHASMAQSDQAGKWVGGSHGAALSFDGTDDYINLGTASDFLQDMGDPETISFWIRTETASNTQVSFCGYYTGAEGFIIILERDSSNKIELFIRDSSPADEILRVSCGAAVNDGDWHHVCIARQDQTAGSVKMYVDGDERTITIHTNDGPQGPHQAEDFFVGARNSVPHTGSPVGYVDCEVFDFRYYNREVLAAEVKLIAAGMG